MQLVSFALLLSVAMFVALVVIAAYVLWSEVVGIDPSIAEEFAAMSSLRRTALALVSGSVLGVATVIAPSVEGGIAGIIMLGASVFGAMLLYELLQDRRGPVN
jgi:hypothetical protein